MKKLKKQAKRVKDDCERFREAVKKMPIPRAMFTRLEFEAMALGGIKPKT